MFIVALYITEIGNNLDISYKRTDKNMVHIHNGVLFNCLKNDIMKFSGIWKQLQNIFPSEVTQTHKKKNGMYTLITGY